MPIQVTRPNSTGPNPPVRTWAEVRKDWSGTWQAIPTLEPIDSARKNAPEIGRAALLYRYGRMSYRGTPFTTIAPRDLTRYYVRIQRETVSGGNGATRPQPLTLFTGRITDDETSPHGPDLGVPSGDSELVAYELTADLDQDPIRTAHVYIDSTLVSIERFPAMNAPSVVSGGMNGNRSAATHTVNGRDVYTYDQAGTEVWTHLEMIQYLLAANTPAGYNIRLAGQYAPLAALRTVQELEGATLYGALNRLIRPQDGFQWRLEIEGDTLLIVVDTILEKPISAGGVTIPANSRQITIDIDSATVAPRIIKHGAGRYDRVVIEGDFIKTMFSLKYGSGLEKGWKTELETEYKTSSGDDDAAKDAYRRREAFRPVFAHFTVPTDWDFQAHGEIDWPAIPDMDGDAVRISSGAAGKVYLRGKRLLRHLLIPATPSGLAPGDEELLAPLAWLKDEDDQYVQVDELRSDKCNGLSLRMLDQHPGVELRGPINHLIAGDDDAPSATEIPSAYDYHDLVVTVAMECDQRLRIVRKTAGVSDPRTLVIERHDAQGWVVVPGTYVDVDADGALASWEITGDGSVIRDDSQYLRAIADLAWQWYGRDRAVMTAQVRGLDSQVTLGSYVLAAVKGASAEQLGTIVTSLSYDYRAQTTSITTGYYEISFREDPLESYRQQRRTHTALRHEREHTQRLDVRVPRTPF